MDNKFFLRLAEIKMKDFMGVEYGELTFSRLKRDWNDEEKIWKSNVVGIYGPNGSSKTTVVESLQILKSVFDISKAMTDSKLLRQFVNPPLSGHYIRFGSDTAELTFLFHCCSDEGPIAKSFRYSFSITGDDPLKIENELFQILDEKGKAIHSLSTKGIADNPTDFFESLVDPNQTIPRLPDNTSICNDKSLILQYSKILPASQKKEARILFNQFVEIIKDHLIILFEDREKAALRNDSLSTIVIPLSLSSKSPYPYILSNGKIIGRNHLLFRKKETVSETLLRQVNFLSDTLETLVPNIRLSVKDEKDKLVMYVDKDGVSIPLEKESYGIKKLIYLCCYIPALFQSSAYMLIIDELDEGLFEHLLGSILMAIQNKAEGQLIFTAHNLRPLQCLDHGSIRFALLPSDTDKDQTKKTNQYSEINCLNKRSNLRDIYYNALNTEE